MGLGAWKGCGGRGFVGCAVLLIAIVNVIRAGDVKFGIGISSCVYVYEKLSVTDLFGLLVNATNRLHYELRKCSYEIVVLLRNHKCYNGLL